MLSLDIDPHKRQLTVNACSDTPPRTQGLAETSSPKRQ